MNSGIFRGQKRVDPLELELQTAVSHLPQVLGVKLWSSTSSVHVLSC